MENAMAVLDTDIDGWIDPQYGGLNCDDINPNATEIWYDGVDSNCDGNNDFDHFLALVGFRRRRTTLK